MASAILTGRPGSPGVGTGWVLVLPGSTASSQAAPAVAAPADPAVESARLDAALATAAAELDALAAQTTARVGEEVGAIFEAQALFARDPGIVGPAHDSIAAGVAADAAIIRSTDAQADLLAGVDDAYFRERAADVRDVGRRVAGLLRGDARPDPWHADGRPAVLVADDLDPSLVATMRPELVAGIALSGGAPTGHAAIVARALAIPLVLGLGEAAVGSLTEGRAAAVDGAGGRVLVDPSPDEVAALTAPAEVVPAVAPGGSRGRAGVAVVANVASVGEAEAAARAGADGIGLVRTELLFLGRTTSPSVAEQVATYRAIAAAMGGAPVVFRTLDVGGDKPAAWRDVPPEANPALGVRGVRLGLRQPALLDDQLTALLSGVPDGDLRIMLPMVSTTDEVTAVRARLDALSASLRAEGRPCAAAVQLGIMVEVPAAALMADVLAASADFFSIGTNDLVQYTLAADRTNPELSDLASALQPAVLRLIASVVGAARAAGRHVAVCGEAAADPAVIPILVGLGVEELSVSPSAIARVRDVVHGLDPDACRALATRALAPVSPAEAQAL